MYTLYPLRTATSTCAVVSAEWRNEQNKHSVFNSAEPTVGHSGLILLLFK